MAGSEDAGGRLTAGQLRLGAADLAFTPGEVGGLLRSSFGIRLPDHAVRVLHHATGGWPAAVALAAPLIAGAGDPLEELYQVAARASLLGGLVDDLLASLGPGERRGLAQLSHLPLLSNKVVEAVTGIPGLLEAAAAAGLPLSRGPAGWRRLPDPVAEHLRRTAALDGAARERAAAVYLEAGEEQTAMTILLAGGLSSEAAAMLAALLPERLERLGLAEVRAVVDALPDQVVERHPRVLLQMARLSGFAYRAAERAEALARCRELAAASTDGRLLREVMAEQALDLVRDGAVDDARAIASEVLENAGEEELSARAQALGCLARLESLWGSDQGSPEKAEALLRRAALVSIQAGHAAWAAELLMRLSQDVFYASCRHLDAIEAIDEALELLVGRPRVRAVALAFRAEPLHELGRYDEARAAVAEMRDLGRLFRDDRILAYAAWEEMLIAAQLGDGAACALAASEVEHHKGAWFEGYTGLEYLAEAADAFDRVGAHARATSVLDEGRARAGAAADRDFRAAEALVTARSLDPAAGRALVDSALAQPGMPVHLAWRLELLGAYADLRRGEPDAGRAAAAVFERFSQLGIAHLPLFVEREVADALLAVAVAAGSRTAAELLAAARTTTIELLGGFEIRRFARPMSLPPGRPATAVKAIAAHGGRLQAEELIELLWPESDPDTGRARLRTVLSRCEREPATC